MNPQIRASIEYWFFVSYLLDAGVRIATKDNLRRTNFVERKANGIYGS